MTYNLKHTTLPETQLELQDVHNTDLNKLKNTEIIKRING